MTEQFGDIFHVQPHANKLENACQMSRGKDAKIDDSMGDEYSRLVKSFVRTSFVSFVSQPRTDKRCHEKQRSRLAQRSD